MQLTPQSFSLQTSSRLLKLKLLLSDSSMALGLFGRLSWICVLFSSGACFPATKADYRYPYTATWGSAGGPAPRSNLQSEGYRSPEVSSLSVGYISPPVDTEKTSFSTQLQPVAGPSGGSNLGSVYQTPRSGFAYPAGNTATAYNFGPRSGYNVAPLPYDNSGSPVVPWAEQPAGGAEALFNDPSNRMLSRPFLDLSFRDSDDQMPQGASILPPSSYIVQSSNGYLRAREVLSHTNYSPEYPELPVYPFRAVKAPTGYRPMTGPEGGYGVPLG